MTGARLIEGLLRYLDSDEGRNSSRDFAWWLVPIVDVDGVEEGYYGKDQIYNDFNRSWDGFFVGRSELGAVVNDIFSGKNTQMLCFSLMLILPVMMK